MDQRIKNLKIFLEIRISSRFLVRKLIRNVHLYNWKRIYYLHVLSDESSSLSVSNLTSGLGFRSERTVIGHLYWRLTSINSHSGVIQCLAGTIVYRSPIVA